MDEKKGTTVKITDTKQLGQLSIFKRFYSSTYKFSAIESRALVGAEAHFEKALTLFKLAKKLLPNLDIDEEQLLQNGYTTAENAHEVCTLLEATILELYSSLDCARKVWVAVFRKSRGMPPDSTRKLFTYVQSGKIFGAPFPQSLIEQIRSADWYCEFLRIRDELTHYDTGTIRRDAETLRVTYTHLGIKVGDQPLIISDVFDWLTLLIAKLNSFLGKTFSILNLSLNGSRVVLLCGFVDGRALSKSVSYTEDISSIGGECLSSVWFELPENPGCPFLKGCPCYQNSPQPSAVPA